VLIESRKKPEVDQWNLLAVPNELGVNFIDFESQYSKAGKGSNETLSTILNL
jgi:hypothetical protein